jgi:plasmid stabilization system protein ParE
VSYRIVIFRRARNDAQVIFDWIAEKSRPGALSWNSAMQAAIRRLKSNPQSFSLAEESDAITEYELRQVLFKTRRGRTYRAVFVVVGGEVHILRIRGPGQSLLSDDDL